MLDWSVCINSEVTRNTAFFKYKETTSTDLAIKGAALHGACLSYLCAIKESKYIKKYVIKFWTQNL
jgi:hypothetical protein